MESSEAKYHPSEILQIIFANYIQQGQFDDMVLQNQKLTYDTTILEWRDICDLVDTNDLWNYLNYYFRLSIDKETWMTVLQPEYEKTLGDLCNFISAHAGKEIITPIKLLGSNCATAAIFRSLTAKLKNRGIDISEIKPSSELEPLIKKYGSVFLGEVNLLAPTVLPPVDYKTNWVYKWGFRLFLMFIFTTLFLMYKEMNWAWITGGLCFLGYIMTWIGSRLKPKQASFAGIKTMGDLVRRINTSSNLADQN